MEGARLDSVLHWKSGFLFEVTIDGEQISSFILYSAQE